MSPLSTTPAPLLEALTAFTGHDGTRERIVMEQEKVRATDPIVRHREELFCDASLPDSEKHAARMALRQRLVIDRIGQ